MCKHEPVVVVVVVEEATHVLKRRANATHPRRGGGYPSPAGGPCCPRSPGSSHASSTAQGGTAGGPRDGLQKDAGACDTGACTGTEKAVILWLSTVLWKRAKV